MNVRYVSYSFETGKEYGTTKVMSSWICFSDEVEALIAKEIKRLIAEQYPNTPKREFFKVSMTYLSGAIQESVMETHPQYLI